MTVRLNSIDENPRSGNPSAERPRMGFYQIQITESEFRRIGEYIHSQCGIKMPPAKKSLLQSRLNKRLRELGMRTFTEYFDFILTPEGQRNELIPMIDAVTTNKTEFFREPKHFDFLVQTALPALMESRDAGASRPLRLWSAGCSTGEEPYTLAIVLSEYGARLEGRFFWSILASDISTKVLEKAKLGIYDEAKIESVSQELRRRYMLRSKDRADRLVRINPALRSAIEFRRINLMEDDYGVRDIMDIVFFRNVIIYFDRPTQEAMLRNICRHMRPGGFIFLGHAETMHGLDVPAHHVAPSVYRRE